MGKVVAHVRKYGKAYVAVVVAALSTLVAQGVLPDQWAAWAAVVVALATGGAVAAAPRNKTTVTRLRAQHDDSDY